MVDMAKWKFPSIVYSPKVYVSCTVISYDYIDSKHNMIEIHREIKKLPDKGKSSSRCERSWDSTCDKWGTSYKGVYRYEARNVRNQGGEKR